MNKIPAIVPKLDLTLQIWRGSILAVLGVRTAPMGEAMKEMHVVSTRELHAAHRLSTPVFAHIAHWIRNPDPGSQFDQKTKWFRWLPMPIVIKILFGVGYEGLVFVDRSNTVIGHVFFQRHDDALKAFHWYIKEEERGIGHMQMITNAFFDHARSTPGISQVRIGAGGNDRIARLWNHIREGKIVPDCGIKAGHEIGWLYFPERMTA